MASNDHRAALAVAVRAAREVGEYLRPRFGQALIRAMKDGNAYSVVTDEDVRSEHIIREALARFDDSIPIQGEELGGAVEGVSWLVDPIDGTGHFVRGTPFCTSMLALVEGPDVLAGVIYDFMDDAMYTAVRGGGAYCDERRLHVVDRGMSSSYVFFDFDLREPGHPELLQRMARICTPMDLVACGYSYLTIARGSFDGRLVKRADDASYWDHAPGTLLVQEAGGSVTNFGKDTYDYRSGDFLVGTPSVHRALSDLVSS
jgi:myo-inositol-1(or 4)-monophosphatase